MKANYLGLIVCLCFYTSCATQSVQPEEQPAPAVKPIERISPSVRLSSLKKNIEYTDLKKNNEEKSPKKRIVVLPFVDSKQVYSLDVLKKAQLGFIDQLNATEEVVAIDASQLKYDVSQSVKNGRYDLHGIINQIQSEGVSAVLSGQVVEIRLIKSKTAAFEVVVDAQMLSVRSEQEIFHMLKTVKLSDESIEMPSEVTAESFFKRNPELVQLMIQDAFNDFSDKLIESLAEVTWEGRIAAVQGEKIFLNVGKISGVQVGDILKVVEDGSEVYDPEIGYHIGQVPGRIKGTLEVVGYFGQDGAISILHSGAGFKENDRIELYQ